MDGTSHQTPLYGEGTPAGATAAVRPMLETVRGAFAAPPHEIIVACEPDLRLPVDHVIQLGRVASEGVSNALKHAFPPGCAGRIWLRCEEERGRIRLTVRDNGVGIPDIGAGGAGKALLDDVAHQFGGFARMGSAPFGGGELALVFSRGAAPGSGPAV